MQRWRTWSGGICLVALLAPGCATFTSRSAAKHPVPAALAWPAFDRDVLPERAIAPLPEGTAIYSLPSEDSVRPAEIWSTGAAQQRDAFWQRILRDRCAAREALQMANGGKAEPDGVCEPRTQQPGTRSREP